MSLSLHAFVHASGPVTTSTAVQYACSARHSLRRSWWSTYNINNQDQIVDIN